MADSGPSRDPAVLGIRLRSAREACGVTQAQAAIELGVSRPLLIAIEKGSREVRPAELVKLAKLYKRPVSELLRPGAPPVAIGTQLRSALSSVAEVEFLSAIVGRLEKLADNYLDLLRRAESGVPGRYPPSWSIRHLDPDRAAEDLASEERNRLGAGDGPVTSLRELVEVEAGLRVFIQPMPARVAGLYVYVEPLGGCVALNARHPLERRRWTLAHEYAHFLASRDRAEVTTLSPRRQIPETERFADAFAANFLMPRTGLSRRFNELKRSQSSAVTAATLVQLARAYQVSVKALVLRLEETRLVSSGSWNRLKDRDFKPRPAEQLPDSCLDKNAESLPFYYRILATQLFADGQITEGQLASYLETDIVGARRIYQQLTTTRDVSADGDAQIFDLAEAVG